MAGGRECRGMRLDTVLRLRTLRPELAKADLLFGLTAISHE